jgi:hypothetical protein
MYSSFFHIDLGQGKMQGAQELLLKLFVRTKAQGTCAKAKHRII